MTRRERLENKVQRRLDWSAGAQREAESRFGAADRISERFYGGQPILVGHHSEGKARRDQARMHGNMSAGLEAQQRAEHHAAKADGLAHQLERTVFSDDPDAVERIEARIRENEEKAEKYTAINKAWRKSKGDVAAIVASGVCGEKLAQTMAETMRLCPWLKAPLDATNLRARIRADRERLVEVQRRQQLAAKAEAAGGTVVERRHDWAVVTFAEKPAARVLDALREAGYRWSGGSWVGPADKLPAGIE